MYCYNIGCSKTFEVDKNTENSCRYHSEKPTFHDGKKGWQCCKKFSTDFSTCLSTPGCQVGFHNPVKPEEEAKPIIDAKYDTPVVIVNPIVKKETRASGDEEMVTLSVSEATQLRSEIRRRKEEEESRKMSNGTTVFGDGVNEEVPIGTQCTNKSCKRAYSNSSANKEICLYHSGEAIFHEGMKFWTCCVRKTSDFDAFLAQEGCTSGKHVWFKKMSTADCKHDWFQAGSNVTISLYAKLTLPDSLQVKANGVKLSVAFDFECGVGKYEKIFDLFEEIDPSSSHVKIGCNKVEIILRKKQFSNWTDLEYHIKSAN